MKLKNSIQELKDIVQASIDRVGIERVKAAYKECEYKDDKDTAFCWSIWFNIPQDKRQGIIALSIERSEWTGGYAEYSDNQLLTLLRKSIPLDKIRG